MATTIGDLFVRVTAKDQQFNQKMRGVKKTVGSVGGSIGRMAGMFGLALGPAAAIGATLALAVKYSGQASRSAALLGAEWTRTSIAIGQGFGEVWSLILDDVRALVELLNDSELWSTIGEAFADAYKGLKSIIDLIARFFGGEIDARKSFDQRNKPQTLESLRILQGKDAEKRESKSRKEKDREIINPTDPEVVMQLKILNRTMRMGVPQ